MASPVNSHLKYFICFLVVATFSFLVMFCLSLKYNVRTIYGRNVIKLDFHGAAENGEMCIGQGQECRRGYFVRGNYPIPGNQLVLSNEFPTVGSSNETLSDTSAIQKPAASTNVKDTANEVLKRGDTIRTVIRSSANNSSIKLQEMLNTDNVEESPKGTSKNDTSVKDWWQAMLKRQTERKLHLRLMCETKYNQSVLPLTEFVQDNKRLYSFYYIDKFKLVYSFVHKVGSSNWARLLKTLSSSSHLKRLYHLSQREALWRLQNYTSFIIVRNPLARLLSAYKDKFVEHHIAHFKSIGRQILKTYRDGVTRQELKRADDVRFEEFLRYLVANKKNRGNTHWDHLIIRNKVCLFKYDIIAKLETGEDDTKFILKAFNLEGLVGLGSHYTNYTGKQDVIKSFYSTIPDSLLQSVVNTYESDFVLFNYSMNVS